MLRVLLLFCLAFATAGLASPATAQVGPKAYAPEDLRELNVPDRIRVLEKEYSEQSGGRRLPDDQLEFYLDQIDSGWTFSRIKTDMARSLGGGQGSRPPGGGWGPPSGWQQRTVICSSIKDRYAQCGTPFRGRARLVENISRTRCIENRNWGSRRGMVWVDDGCRGRFAEAGGWGPSDGYNITCSSVGDRYTTCAWSPGHGRPVLIEQLSRSQCVEGRTWGYRSGQIWVDRGCRGRFGSRR